VCSTAEPSRRLELAASMQQPLGSCAQSPPHNHTRSAPT
jgi:hypothetical protein